MDWERHFRGMPKGSSVSFGADFGAVARGVTQGNGAVIPPGRYWLDSFGDKRQVFLDWAKSKPEVKIQTTQEDADSTPPHLFTIFVIPATSSNFGSPGVWFPTQALGFPTVADETIQSAEDTVQRPPVPTSSDVLSDIAASAGKAGSSLFSQLSTSAIVKVVFVAGLGFIAFKAVAPTIIKMAKGPL